MAAAATILSSIRFSEVNPCLRAFFRFQNCVIVFVASSNHSRSASSTMSSTALKNLIAFVFGLPNGRSFPAETRMATSSVVQFCSFATCAASIRASKSFAAHVAIAASVSSSVDSDLGRWPNRDPLGEAGGINLYDYVGNNPINYVDPLGLYVSITTADGVTTTIPTTTGALINALQNDVNSGSQVTGIIIAGHGTPNLITLDAAQTQLLIASNGKILLVDGSNDDNTTSTDITDLLKKALAPKATIQLNACHTAKGDNNLTKDFSQILPNTPISGISTYAIGPVATTV
jgi:hypothetical protein